MLQLYTDKHPCFLCKQRDPGIQLIRAADGFHGEVYSSVPDLIRFPASVGRPAGSNWVIGCSLAARTPMLSPAPPCLDVLSTMKPTGHTQLIVCTCVLEQRTAAAPCQWHYITLHYITLHVIKLTLLSKWHRLSRRHTPWVWGYGPRSRAQQLCRSYRWPQQGSNHRPCGSKSSSLTATLQAAPITQQQITN